jgi:DNA modification methylase
LCEIAYRWFCPPGGTVLDPFAGGSVRGIVAAKLGRRYFGVDLRAEQVADATILFDDKPENCAQAGVRCVRV